MSNLTGLLGNGPVKFICMGWVWALIKLQLNRLHSELGIFGFSIEAQVFILLSMYLTGLL